MMKQNNLRGSLLLLLAAMIWGLAFVAQRVGMDALPPFAFNGIRMLLGGTVLLPVIRLTDKLGISKPNADEAQKRHQRIAGLLCGLFLFAASCLQQCGLTITTAGKAGFITALYVVLVPVAGLILFRRNAGRMIWLSVILAVAGLYLLCCPAESFNMNTGDLLVLLCAVCYTGHILTVDHWSPFVDGVRLSCTQFFVTGVLSMLVSLLTERMTWAGMLEAAIPLLYAGVFSSGVAFTLQILAQRETDPTVASLMMCLESVFAVLSGALILGEVMSTRETLGCIIMFAAVLLAQLSPLLFRKKRQKPQH